MEVDGNAWTWLEWLDWLDWLVMAANEWNGCKWLKVAENGWNWV